MPNASLGTYSHNCWESPLSDLASLHVFCAFILTDLVLAHFVCGYTNTANISYLSPCYYFFLTRQLLKKMLFDLFKMFHHREGWFWRVSYRSEHPHFTSSAIFLNHVMGVPLIVASIYGLAKEDALPIERGRQKFCHFAVINSPNAATQVEVIVTLQELCCLFTLFCNSSTNINLAHC